MNMFITQETVNEITAIANKSYFMLHPIYAPAGTLKADLLENDGTTKVLCLDRNVLSILLNTVKTGTFDVNDRIPITSLLLWSAINDYYICPYDALKENAYNQNDNIAGNKERDLFNYIYDVIGIKGLIEGFNSEGNSFKPKKFAEANSVENIDFTNDNADFFFLYSAMLHFVYVLKTVDGKEKQFKAMMSWYFDNCLVSGYALTYMILYFTDKGITLPHNFSDNNKVIAGCKNQAMDLLYVQEIDPKRYPSIQYTLIVVTQDKMLKTIFERYHEASNFGDEEKFVKNLCKNLSEEKQEKYVSIFMDIISKHVCIDVNENNKLEVSRKLAKTEELRLREIL